jgi:hypothetical protein
MLAVIDKAEKIAREIGGVQQRPTVSNDVADKTHTYPLLAVLPRMRMTTHGLRPSFRTWA